MSKSHLASIACIALLCSLTISVSPLQAQGRGGRGMGRMQAGGVVSNQAFAQGAAVIELEQLLLMRDEEKLAHDVYVALGKTSGLSIFNTISAAESQHMQALARAIQAFYPNSQLVDLPVGKFAFPQHQVLYDTLVQSGKASTLAALQVGMKVEEMDIADLQSLINQGPPSMLSKVLENLQRASRNHLRAFAAQLRTLGGSYQPIYISQNDFDAVVNSAIERGPGAVGNNASRSASGNQSSRGPGNRGRGGSGKGRGRSR